MRSAAAAAAAARRSVTIGGGGVTKMSAAAARRRRRTALSENGYAPGWGMLLMMMNGTRQGGVLSPYLFSRLFSTAFC